MDNKSVYIVQINYSKNYSMNILPLGPLSVATELRKAGYRPEIIHISETGIDRAVRKIVSGRPLYVAFSVMTGIQTAHSALMSEKIKKFSSVPVIWGGTHPSILPEMTLRESYVDYVVIGEGEKTITELSDAVLRGSGFGGVKGIGYKDDGKPVFTEPRPLETNLDRYTIDYTLVDMNKYFMSGHSGKYKKMLPYKSSRGCPFNCAFCYNLVFNRSKWRPMSAEKVLRDINFLKERYDIDGIRFYDDNFFADRARALKILKGMDCAAHFEIRIDALDEDLVMELSALKDVNLMVGIESGSDRMLKLIKKGYGVDTIMKGVDLLGKYKLKTTYSAILGLPTETAEEMNKTLDLLCRIHSIHKNKGYTVGAYLPYPGTTLYELAVSEGFKPPENTLEWGNIDRFTSDFQLPWADTKFLYVIREYFKFIAYDIPFLTNWMMFRIKKRFFKYNPEIPVVEFFAGIALKRNSIIGKMLRKALFTIRKRRKKR
ncbi:MAG: radical SAM protein [bacterium]|nr:radical SAM protein [bacterium]